MTTRPILIRQQRSHDCMIAALAMMTGLSYENVVTRFPRHDLDNGGLDFMTCDAWLAESGHAVRRKFKHYSPERRDRDPWPPDPFADAHWGEVFTHSNRAHAIVWLRDGAVLDPACDEPKQLTDYRQLNWVAAIYPLPFGMRE